MFDEVLATAKVMWCDSDRVDNIQETRQTAHYWVSKNSFFRFKKSDSKGYTCNYPTQTSIEFHNPQSELFDLANKLEVTYVLNTDQTEIVDIQVVHRLHDKVDFAVSILRNGENVVSIADQMESLPNPPAKSKIAKLKVIKKDISIADE